MNLLNSWENSFLKILFDLNNPKNSKTKLLIFLKFIKKLVHYEFPYVYLDESQFFDRRHDPPTSQISSVILWYLIYIFKNIFYKFGPKFLKILFLITFFLIEILRVFLRNKPIFLFTVKTFNKEYRMMLCKIIFRQNY